MIYLLGGDGYVGRAYQYYFKRRQIRFLNIKRSDLNYADLPTLISALKMGKPEFVINAAGYTGKPNVDACEDHKRKCLEGNAVLPGCIAEACASVGIPWGHVSSGCIFSGARPDGSGFTEEDSPNFTFRQNNCSFYSGSKALGEEVLAGMPEIFIWRLRIPFNNIPNPRNYLMKVMTYGRLLDATNSLSDLDEFVSASFACWEKKVSFGTYNVTNPGQITTRQIVDRIVTSGLVKKEFSFFRDEEEFMKFAARTPRSNCVLSSAKLASVGIKMREVNEAVDLALKRWQREGMQFNA
jgi:dTDP-4-dehydrorhamnose reductase